MYRDTAIGLIVALTIVVIACLWQRSKKLHADRVCKVNRDLRKLWYDHVARTRAVIKANVFSTPDLAAETTHLLQNQNDIGDAAAAFLGHAAGDQLTKLLREHIMIADAIVKAAKAKQPIDALNAQWTQNADKIAAFLSAGNPKLLKSATAMMLDHLALTAGSLNLQLAGKYDEDVAQFDKIVAQALHMADMMTGVVLGRAP
jgi:hypothetical protein